jgi:methionine sulfoxide reductase catalytic subunit
LRHGWNFLVSAFLISQQYLVLATLNRLPPSEHYTEEDISPRFWPNGKIADREDWKQLADGGFHEFKLKVGGLVENSVELSLADIEEMGVAENITMHHCIQGWTGIAKWGGLPMKSLVELVRPKASAKVVAFYSFGGGCTGAPIMTRRASQTCSRQNACSLPR